MDGTSASSGGWINAVTPRSLPRRRIASTDQWRRWRCAITVGMVCIWQLCIVRYSTQTGVRKKSISQSQVRRGPLKCHRALRAHQWSLGQRPIIQLISATTPLPTAKSESPSSRWPRTETVTMWTRPSRDNPETHDAFAIRSTARLDGLYHPIQSSYDCGALLHHYPFHGIIRGGQRQSHQRQGHRHSRRRGRTESRQGQRLRRRKR